MVTLNVTGKDTVRKPSDQNDEIFWTSNENLDPANISEGESPELFRINTRQI